MEYELKVLYDLLDKGMLEYAEANEGEGKSMFLLYFFFLV